MSTSFSEKKLHKIGRIDQIVRDYFSANKSVNERLAKDLMPLFIEKGIFLKDERNGLPIRKVLRELDAAGKLNLLKHVKVIRKDVTRNWYFTGIK
jgi:hypothetical protein